MRHQIKLPRVGDTTQTALISEWTIAVGEVVEVGTPLAMVETDKVTVEVPSPVAGTVVEQVAAVGDEVDVGAAICVIES
ncbi:MAG: dihydrolipoamide succinyltransferase [Acidimicrobiaceae bacterium]|nr:dihydrolipoamide succinyltransferase [Acidimicrobiaceae bacterium]